MFLERLQVFSYDKNEYYVPCGEFNKNSATHSLAMPNCTTYAFLRMHEASEQEDRQNKWVRESGGWGNAKTWYSTTTLPKGSVPKVGAVAVWDGSTGHVCVVERVIDSNHVVMSESNYSSNKKLRDWHFFNMRNNLEVQVGKATISGCGKLIGFIYIPVNDKRVSRDTSKDQVEILQTMVNVRQKPSTSAALVAKGLYCPVGIYNVLEWSTANGYTWARLDTGCWVACGAWSKIYKKESTSKAELKARLKELKARKEELEDELEEVNDEIKEIEAKLK